MANADNNRNLSLRVTSGTPHFAHSEYDLSEVNSCDLNEAYNVKKSRKKKRNKDKTGNGDCVQESLDVSLDIDPVKSYSNLRNQLCQTENEYKAQKLNRAEECKLRSFKIRVQKEQYLLEKQLSKSAQVFRARSAKLLGESDNVKAPCQSASYIGYGGKPRVIHGRVRPKSTPVYLSNFNQTSPLKPAILKKKCSTCKRVQNVVTEYEKHCDHKSTSGTHTRFVFTDRQVKTFLNILETNYCSDIPEMTNFIHQTNRSFDDINHFHSDHSNDDQRIQNRIRKFCKSQDVFNKLHPLPDQIKLGLEQIRMNQATSVKRAIGPKTLMMDDVRRKLGIHRI